MVYRFRVVLDTVEDVFRDIEILKTNSLEDLHNVITQSFGFDGTEMASFYVSDDEWSQGEEIVLFDMSEGVSKVRMMNETAIEFSRRKAIAKSVKYAVLPEVFPHKDKKFDLVISLGCLHNLRIFELGIALKEIERVGRQGYVMVESYRSEQEQFNLQCWALTCESFFDVDEWMWLYDRFGYTGDYEYIFFE